MDVYRATFGVLVAGSVSLAYSQYRRDKEASKGNEARSGSVELDNAATVFRWKFIPVYLLVMSSDWLQAIRVPRLYYSGHTDANSGSLRLYSL